MGDMTGVFTPFCGVRAYECLAAWCSRLRALWAFLSSSQATSSVESAQRFKPASRMAESGTLCRGVHPGCCDSLYGVLRAALEQQIMDPPRASYGELSPAC